MMMMWRKRRNQGLIPDMAECLCAASLRVCVCVCTAICQILVFTMRNYCAGDYQIVQLLRDQDAVAVAVAAGQPCVCYSRATTTFVDPTTFATATHTL